MAFTLKICVYGAGAIGSWLGARLHIAGYSTTLVTRGPHLEKLTTDGLTFIDEGNSETLRIPATEDVSSLGKQDLIFVTLKAHSIPQVVEQIKSLMHKDSVVITAVNGVPWWFFYRLGADFPEQPVYSVDPEGRIWNDITPAKTVGCVIYPSADLPRPGTVTHLSGDQLPIGEPDGTESERAQLISEVLTNAQCRSPIRKHLRNEIWIKLLGNLGFNPLSVLLNETLDKLATGARSRALAAELMVECLAVGKGYGLRIGMTIEKRINGAAKVGPHRTSMLQDYLRGKPLEVGSIVDAVIELAELVSVPVPTIHKARDRLLKKLSSENISTN